jgi:hypothetical protein
MGDTALERELGTMSGGNARAVLVPSIETVLAELAAQLDGRRLNTASRSLYPVWSPDGTGVAFGAGGVANIFRIAIPSRDFRHHRVGHLLMRSGETSTAYISARKT